MTFGYMRYRHDTKGEYVKKRCFDAPRRRQGYTLVCSLIFQ